MHTDEQKENNPLISIIIPCFNSLGYIDDCIRSIREQTYSSYELILVDDGSDDGSTQKLRLWKEYIEDATLIEQENQGVSVSRNNGLNKAKGELVLFLDSDDQLQHEALALCVDTFMRHDVELVFFESALNEANGVALKNKKIAKGRPSHFYNQKTDSFTFFVESILYDQYIEQPCMFMAKRSAIGSLRFSEGYIYEDSLFVTQLLTRRSVALFSLPEKLYLRTARSDSLTHRPATLHNFYSYIHVYSTIKKMADARDHDSIKVCLDRFGETFLVSAILFTKEHTAPLKDHFRLARLISANRKHPQKYRKAVNMVTSAFHPKRIWRRSLALIGKAEGDSKKRKRNS